MSNFTNQGHDPNTLNYDAATESGAYEADQLCDATTRLNVTDSDEDICLDNGDDSDEDICLDNGDDSDNDDDSNEEGFLDNEDDCRFLFVELENFLDDYHDRFPNARVQIEYDGPVSVYVSEIDDEDF